MKKYKRLISVYLTIIMICCSVVSVSATATNEEVTKSNEIKFAISEGLILDESLSLEEQLALISNSTILTEKQKSQAISKINFTKQINTLQYGQTRASTVTYNCTVSIPYFKQNNSYYCGPATTKQSMHYLTGSSQSQSSIASALGTTTAGTDGNNMVTYLNANQSNVYYMAIYPYSQASMEDLVYRGLTSYGTAPILRLKMTTSQGWPYNSTGHFMNVSGQYTVSGAVKYQVTDPYIQYVNSSETDGKYRISSSAVYNSTINHFAQRFYY